MPGKGAKVLEAIANDVLGKFPKPSGPRQYDAGVLSSCLNRAWGTELLLATSMRFAQQDEMMRLSNSWGCVQLTTSVTPPCKRWWSPAASLYRPATRRPKSRHSRFGESAGGVKPFLRRQGGGCVDPQAYTHDLAATSRACRMAELHEDELLGHRCYALRSTRKDAVDAKLADARLRKVKQKRKDWQEKEDTRLAKGKPPKQMPIFKTAHLSPAEKDACEQGVRAYGWLDYLYRFASKRTTRKPRCSPKARRRHFVGSSCAQHGPYLDGGDDRARSADRPNHRSHSITRHR